MYVIRCNIFNWFIFWIYRCSQICLEVASHPGTSGDFNMQCHASTSVSSGNDNSSSQKTRQNDARSLEAATDVPFYCQFIPFLNNWTSWTPASYNKQHNNVKKTFWILRLNEKTKQKLTPLTRSQLDYILDFRFVLVRVSLMKTRVYPNSSLKVCSSQIFVFWYFGYFSCMIFFPVFSVMPILPCKM